MISSQTCVLPLLLVLLTGFDSFPSLAEDDTVSPFRPESDSTVVNSFSSGAHQKEGNEVHRKGVEPEIDPALDYMWRFHSISPKELNHYQNLTPAMIERVRTHFLERLDSGDRYELAQVLLTVSFLKRKMIEWDDLGTSYKKDALVETILRKIQSNDPRFIMDGISSLEGLKDARVHAYIASFLDHEIGVVRRTAERVLSTTKPDASSPENTHSPVASGGEEKSEINGDETEEATGKGMSIEWLLTGAVVVAGIAVFFWLLTGKNRRSSKT